MWLHANYNFVIAKTHAKEVARAGLARRTRNAQTSASFGIPKLPEFLDITEASKEERSTREADGDEAAGGGLAAEERSNTSAVSDLGSREHPQASLG